MHGQHRTVHRRPNGLVGRLCRIAGRYAHEVRRQVQIPCGAQCNEPCRRLAVRFLAASRRRHGWFPCRRHRPPPRSPRSTVSSARFRRVPAARNARPTPTIVRFKGYQIGSWLPRPRALAPARRLPPSTPSTPDATPGARPPAACPSPHFSPGRFVGVKKLMGFKKLTATPTITPIADCAGRARPALRAGGPRGSFGPVYTRAVYTRACARTCSLNRRPRYALGPERALRGARSHRTKILRRARQGAHHHGPW